MRWQITFLSACSLVLFYSCTAYREDDQRQIVSKEKIWIDLNKIVGTWQIIDAKVIDKDNQFLKECKKEYGSYCLALLDYYKHAFIGCQLIFKSTYATEILYVNTEKQQEYKFPDIEYGSYEAYQNNSKSSSFTLFINGSSYFTTNDTSHNNYIEYQAIPVSDTELKLKFTEASSLLEINFLLKKELR